MRSQNPVQPSSTRDAKAIVDINRSFPNKVCINLDRRADRWERMKSRFDQHGICDVRHFSAINGQGLTIPETWASSNGAYWCLLSHLQVVREARDEGSSSVLIFEDDVVFDAHFTLKFNTYIRQLPEDWDMLYFGALHLDDLVESTENICRVRRSYSTYAYALKSTLFDAFIELNSNADCPVDDNNHFLQQRYQCYCFMPHLAWCESDDTDVQERCKDHWYLRESLVVHGRSMDYLLQHTTLIMAYSNPENNESITQNLLFLARHYSERLHLNVIIVEQGVKPTIHRMLLPQACRYSLVENDGLVNRGRCFNIGMELSDAADAVLIFSDSDIFSEAWDLCGNVRLCQRYDGTTGFQRLIELTKTDTLNLQENKAMLTPWFDATRYARKHKSESSSHYCFLRRESIQSVGGWTDDLTAGAPIHLRTGPQLQMFSSPNDALRLHHD